MKFKLEIDMDNDAFFVSDGDEEVRSNTELARLLRVVFVRVLDSFENSKLRDENGNTVGHYEFED